MACNAAAAKLGAFVCAAGQPVIALESFAACYEEALPLLERHRQEISHYPDIPLEVDTGRYEAAEAVGKLRVYTARIEGNLVGYAVFFVMPNGHYVSSLQAVQDVLYVAPEHRRGSVGLRLVREAERMLAAADVQVIYHHVKHAHPALGAILSRRGYEPVETVYAKRMY